MTKIGILKRRRFLSYIRFGLFTCFLFGIVFYIETKEVLIQQLAVGFVFGIMIGILEDITSHRKFTTVSLPLQFLIKLLGIFLILLIIASSLTLSFVTFHEVDFKTIWSHVKGKHISGVITSSFFVAITASTYFQIERLIGRKLLFNYLSGRYRKPKKEIRVFLFLDLKSSTTLSEKLGNETYYSFLNDAIYDMSQAIIETKAEIYQYVGDEIVFTWTLDKGITNNNCLRLYEKIKEKLESRKSFYLKIYGFQPEFKAALHAGIVLAAEIGHIKKDIVYSGDVLNVTARMESLCNKYDAEILISKSLFNLLERKHEIICEDVGQPVLKGKDEKLELIKIYSSDANFKKEREQLKKSLKVK